MSYPPTLKQLRYLTSLKKTGHFGRAAELCHVSQSTLSAGLQELESLLGVALVERTKRQVLFTPLGDVIAGRAETILLAVDDLTALADAARDPLVGEVKLGVIPTVAPFLLPAVMPTIRRDLPGLSLVLREEKSADLCGMLKRGDLDCVLFALPFDCGDVTEYPLFEDEFVAAYPAGEAPRGGVGPQALQATNLMLLEEGHCLRDHALDACNLASKQTRSGLSGTSLHTLIQMVAGGQGVTLLPDMAVKSGLCEGLDVDILPLSGVRAHRVIGLIWRPANPRDATFRALGEVIKQAHQAGQ